MDGPEVGNPLGSTDKNQVGDGNSVWISVGRLLEGGSVVGYEVIEGDGFRVDMTVGGFKDGDSLGSTDNGFSACMRLGEILLGNTVGSIVGNKVESLDGLGDGTSVGKTIK